MPDKTANVSKMTWEEFYKLFNGKENIGRNKKPRRG